VVISVLIVATALNYLDRQLLAALAPALKSEFHISNEQYGLVLLAFSLAYAAAAPLAGLTIDRIGLTAGMSLAVSGWSAAGMLTGLVGSFPALLACRAALGGTEAAAIPGFGKANAVYMPPREFALGTAVNQIGISIGGIAAPLIAASFAAAYGWRAAFVACGAAGLLWIPVWLYTARRIPQRVEAVKAARAGMKGMLEDRRFWGLVAANLLYMTTYTLWTNWTTLYFVEARGMTQADANARFAWIPPVFATAGGLAGGALAFRMIRGGLAPFAARMRICWLSAILLLSTAAVPLMPTTAWAAAAISFSYFCTLAMSTNVYAMPIDFFGANRAAFGVSALTFAYGLMQAAVSPLMGRMIDSYGFASVCSSFSALPLLAVVVLHVTGRPRGILRPAEPRDTEAIRRIEEESGSAHWDYSRYECTVAEIDGLAAGYLLVRKVAVDEFEILNVAVSARFRRKGIAGSLIRAQMKEKKGQWFLEVRESNTAARSLYEKIGFHETGKRPRYYSDPPESGIVMSIRSC
jgi:ACS family hexuronate transporter-like MFS transporter